METNNMMLSYAATLSAERCCVIVKRYAGTMSADEWSEMHNAIASLRKVAGMAEQKEVEMGGAKWTLQN